MKNLAYVLILTVLFCSGCKYFRKSSPKPVQIVSSDSDSIAQTYDSTANYAPGSTQAATPVEQSIQTSSAVTGRYYMIVGCFKVSANADNYAQKLKGMGYEAEILPGPGEFRMVSARSYDNYRESVAAIDKFRTDLQPEAWVYRQK
ncbi:MAG TPA: SPOR domain-containing protein [Bacteroidales bacterium]|nr:SPOR domain-containing protein [Bacteroidales bacterium]